jgi:hypothetical protein
MIAVDAAIISGLSAIGGALVGSVAGGVVGWRLERRRAGRQAKAGARLLRADLSINQTRLSDAISELRWWPFYHMRIEPWSRYRDAMAEELNAEIWGEVSQSAIELQELGEEMRKAPGFDDQKPMTISERQAHNFILIRANAIRAFNALGKLADDEEELPPSDPPEIGSKR